MHISGRRRKILFIIPSLQGGGSERVITHIVNNLDRNKFDITLALIRGYGQFSGLDIREDIKVIILGSKRVRYSLPKILYVIFKEDPDIVFSTLGYLNILMSIVKLMFPNKKFVVRESSIVSMQNKREPYPCLFNMLYKYIYRNLDLIICQSYAMKKDLNVHFGISEDKLSVIHNPVDTEVINKLSTSNCKMFGDNRNILAVGRLSYEKGFDILINIMKMLDKTYHLYIIGEGEYRRTLEDMSQRLNVQDRIHFLGFQKNPYKYMAKADLLVLSSRYEGLPNVVLEANALGTPVVAFDCPGGTREIIKDGVNGFLAECGNIEDLASKIQTAFAHKWDREHIKKLTIQKFGLQKIVSDYENILSNL